MKTSLGNLAEGTIVPMLERGSKVNYIVAKHNYQSDVNGGGHTMLIRAGVLGSYEWKKSSSNSYELPEYAKYDTDSKIPDVLENYYQGVFDALTLAACKPVQLSSRASSSRTEAPTVMPMLVPVSPSGTGKTFSSSTRER